MSPKPKPRVGLSTAAETAWYEQEPAAEHVPAERSSESRRLLILIGVGVALVGSVLLVASLAGTLRRPAQVAAAPRLQANAEPLQPPSQAPAVNAAVAATPAKPPAVPARPPIAPRAPAAASGPPSPPRKVVRAPHSAAAPTPAHKPATPRSRTPAAAPRKPSHGHFTP